MLKDSKAKGLSYADAQERLSSAGYTPAEIEQASYMFTYSTITDIDTGNSAQKLALKQAEAFGNATIHEQAIDAARKEVTQKYGRAMFLGGFVPGLRLSFLLSWVRYKSLQSGRSKANIWTWMFIVALCDFIGLTYGIHLFALLAAKFHGLVHVYLIVMLVWVLTSYYVLNKIVSRKVTPKV